MIRVLTFALALSISACARAEPPQAIEADAAGDPVFTAASAKAWLAENGRKPGIVTLPSGVQYKVLTAGPKEGVPPKAADTIKVHYEGTLTDGQMFDSSYTEGTPLVARLSNLVPGWVEALQLMRPGDSWMLYLPPEKGYGAEGAGPIPPHSVLVFKIELLGVLPNSAAG